MTILEYMKDNFLVLDGGMGTLLQAAGLKPGELPERWNLEHPEVIVGLQQAYFDAGSNAVLTNTFGANVFKFGAEELRDIVFAAVANARAAAAQSTGTQAKFVGLDIGPLGRLLAPLGDLPFEEAVAAFAAVVRAGTEAGVDFIFIETMNDSYESKAALLAAKENADLPVFSSNAYGADGKLMTGASPAAMVALLEGMGAVAIGANCSLGPDQLAGVMDEYLAYANVPVLCKPNAGLPRSVDGRTIYDVTPEEFATSVAKLLQRGVRIIGGCCGTTPDYIRAVVAKIAELGLEPVPITPRRRSLVSSYTHAVEFGAGMGPVLIGERINPTGKRRFQRALREHDMDFLLGEGLRQQDAGVHVLDVNVGLPEIDEVAMLEEATRELQAVCDLPLQLDSTSPEALEAAMRIANGKPMVNSVNGTVQVMDAIFPLVAKYGGLCVALTLDEDGIPATARGRADIAKRIIARAAEYGIGKEDLIFDPLAMTISADTGAAKVTLEAVRLIHEELGALTTLGVSNVSFGLPERNLVTSTFFAMALDRGLDAAIMNPFATEMMSVYHTFRALSDRDPNCLEYIDFAGKLPAKVTAPAAVAAAAAGSAAAPAATGEGTGTGVSATPADGDSAARSPLQQAIIRGLKDKAGALAKDLLATEAPLDVVQTQVIPALNVVGEEFEAKRVYLPQLLMAAEAAKAAFEEIKARMVSEGGGSPTRCAIVIATVHGDIHDIGKNIVRLLLENYGFAVCDLGKDVPEETIAAKVEELHAPLVGLSALMTTTVPAMERTIKLLRERTPWAKVCVGGAVLTQAYADAIGADAYCKDAMESVRWAEAEEARLLQGR